MITPAESKILDACMHGMMSMDMHRAMAILYLDRMIERDEFEAWMNDYWKRHHDPSIPTIADLVRSTEPIKWILP